MHAPTVATRWNLDAIEEAFQRWKRDPGSVDPSWQFFFQGFELAAARPASSADGGKTQTGVARLIYTYRDIGHFVAHLDPLSEPRASHPLLELTEFGLSDADLDRTFDASMFLSLQQATLREILAALRETYCRTVGVEYLHIQDTRIRRWLQERMEPRRNRPGYDREGKLRILKALHYAELFERFLHTRFLGQKRFSLEGAETLIPLLDTIVENAPGSGIQEIVIGMAHRGRLNVLTNILRKPYSDVFAEFEDNYLPESMDGDGDVKYHLGFSSDRVTSRGGKVHLSLTPNPSHLEAVNPVVEGRTRAKQTHFRDNERRRGLPLLIHGDAAFAGQGLVAETLNLSQLAGYTTGGTIHVVVNNQIGFTTAPADARSTAYCTDVAKMIQVPIFHVNAEDPEAACYVAELALEFRQAFGRDVVIDLFCYRRHGHNEGDDPSMTQPLMYQQIKARPTLSTVYDEQLVLSGDLTAEEAQALNSKFEAKLQQTLEEVRTAALACKGMAGFEGLWKGLSSKYSHAPVETGLPQETLREITEGLVRVPPTFTLHPTVAKVLKTRQHNVEEGKGLDWAQAELLAFGSLLLEGTPVRLSGQDSRRGTFSQRHAVLYDARTGEPYSPLNSLRLGQEQFAAYDSLLSEAAVLGFEFGYSLDAPETLVLWEAQFGDFGNGAQVIIDQFISSSESKWRRDSGVVMLLPHGYEGQGPEHSSARLERYLQACAEDNMQVVYPSTPAQYFHLLRRQVKRPFRKPLVVMTPKSMLRLAAAASPLSDFVKSRFHEVLDDATVDPSRVRRVILCTGKIFHDLYAFRAQQPDLADVAIIRVEQFYPYPVEMLANVLSRYRKAKDYIWAQEESQNMGAWWFMEPRLRAMDCPVQYVGRDASASPATGSKKVHDREQKELVQSAFRSAGPHLVRASGGRRSGVYRPVEPAPQQGREKKAATPAS